MADQQISGAQSSSTGKSFGQMTFSEKLSFLGKVCVMLATGGFAFPNVFVE